MNGDVNIRHESPLYQSPLGYQQSPYLVRARCSTGTLSHSYVRCCFFSGTPGRAHGQRDATRFAFSDNHQVMTVAADHRFTPADRRDAYQSTRPASIKRCEVNIPMQYTTIEREDKWQRWLDARLPISRSAGLCVPVRLAKGSRYHQGEYQGRVGVYLQGRTVR